MTRIVTMVAVAAAIVCLAGASRSMAAPRSDAKSAPRASQELRFDEVFREAGEPPKVHFRASYLLQGKVHQLEVWRDGSQLVRRTDDVIETHVARDPKSPSYRMVVLDLQRKIETSVDRDDLYRIGNFTEWFDLAHALRHPRSTYRLTAEQAPSGAPRSFASCRWFALQQGGARTDICWSDRERLPMLMLDAHARVSWQVTAIDHDRISASTFRIGDRGFVRNDASQDISGD